LPLLGQALVNNRKEEISFLRSVINSPVKDGEGFYSSTSRNMAISLLGELRAKEAVEDLIKWLVPQPGQVSKITRAIMQSPASDALFEIGLPSVEPLTELVKLQGNNVPGIYATMLISRIKGAEESELLFARMMEKEPDSAKRRNLQVALDYLRAESTKNNGK
jgi:hypothetical protein